MQFLNREQELERLGELARSREFRLAVLYGRRRVGKTRLMLEWTAQHGGLYTVADQSSPEVQRRYLATAIAAVFPGFADVAYPDWSALLSRLAREATAAKWTGPLVIDELPYLVLSSPELASILQRWVDHEARSARLHVAFAGSSQRMMQGLALSAEAPLYGRAHALFEVKPLRAALLRKAFTTHSMIELSGLHAAWGGIPRYWELASDSGLDVLRQIDRLVLDPLGPLHGEPERLLLEELPPAVELRPILDAIGLGAHRVSEIASRIGRPVTSLSRPLQRLQEMGLVRRDTPFGEPEQQGKRSLYKLDDPFVRLWFKLVAQHRAYLASASAAGRAEVLRARWPGLAAEAWEELCRATVSVLDRRSALGKQGPWEPGRRWWHGRAAEWDLVSRNANGMRLLLGEAKWSAKPFDRKAIERLTLALASKPAPKLHARDAELEQLRVLFVPEVAKGVASESNGVRVVTGHDLLQD
ncbi:MAG TPA: ATP-binding protein [Polyangiales bacterium]|nr:ATP-binding protein [Polyangiales bacterium]